MTTTSFYNKFLQQWNEFYLEFVHSNKFYNDQPTYETVSIDDDDDDDNATVHTQHTKQSTPTAAKPAAVP